MKQTAVESIIEFCETQKNNDVHSHKGAYSTIIKFCEEKAKEMEKQQIIDAWLKGVEDEGNPHGHTYFYGEIDLAEKYYNETFKNK